MSRTYYAEFERNDGTMVTVEYEWRPGRPPTFSDPCNGPEVIIVAAWSAAQDDLAVDTRLTPEEDERICRRIAERGGPAGDWED